MNKEKQIEITEKAIRSSKDKAGALADFLNQEIKELKKVKAKQIEENELIEIANTIVETDFTYRGMCWQGDSFVSCPYGELINCQSCLTAKNILDKNYRKINENEVVISKEELKRLETNYKIGLGKSQSWKERLKERVAEVEAEVYKLLNLNEKLVQKNKKLIKELNQTKEQARKETAEKILERGKYCMPSGLREWIIKEFGVEIKE